MSKFNCDNLAIAYKVIEAIEQKLDPNVWTPFHTTSETISLIEDDKDKSLYQRAQRFISECYSVAEANYGSDLWRMCFG